MGPHAFQGGGHLLAGHECSHGAPFSSIVAVAFEQRGTPRQAPDVGRQPPTSPIAGTRYAVRITNPDHPVTRGISDFEVSSEQYYLHVDPAVKVLATTRFPVADGPHVANGPVDMPVLWTKLFGRGRVLFME
jgi:hypothetical protein